MTLDEALPTFGSLEELDGFMDAARLAGDTFTPAQLAKVAHRKIELQKGDNK